MIGIKGPTNSSALKLCSFLIVNVAKNDAIRLMTVCPGQFGPARSDLGADRGIADGYDRSRDHLHATCCYMIQASFSSRVDEVTSRRMYYAMHR